MGPEGTTFPLYSRRKSSALRATPLTASLRTAAPCIFRQCRGFHKLWALSDAAPEAGARVPVPAQVCCIAGNPITPQPQNGGNGFGWQRDISYTLTATDKHAVIKPYQETVGALCRGDEKGIGNQYVSG